MGYLDTLAALPPDRTLIRPADSRVAILTGQSSFVSSRLSAEQQNFLAAVTPADYEPLSAGFPYHSQLDCFRAEPSMVAASWRNAAQTIWSGGSSRFRRILAQTLQCLLSRTARRLVLVAGSCGLQLANAVWPLLEQPAQLDVRVVALGPACFAKLRIKACVVQGAGDFWSKLFYRGPVDHRVACGHLDYWTSPEVRAITAAEITR